MNIKKRLTISALVIITLLISMPAESQIQNTECTNARVWHLQQAMKINLLNQQDYHLGAAQAADELSTMGGQPCAAWKDWAVYGRFQYK